MKTKNFIAVVFMILSAGTISAQSKPNGQKARVAKGIKSGEITHREAAQIREERQETKAEVKQAKADGVVSGSERKDIKKERRDADKAIREAKHNGTRRS